MVDTDSIKLGVDGTNVSANYAYYKPFGAGDDTWPFDEPMDIIMNVAMGGTLGATKTYLGGDFRYDMYVDYVRVYQTPAVPTAGARFTRHQRVRRGERGRPAGRCVPFER